MEKLTDRGKPQNAQFTMTTEKLNKVLSKFPSLYIKTTHNFFVPQLNFNLGIVLYTLNQKCQKFDQILLANPLLFKNLRNNFVFIPSNTDIPALSSMPINFQYPSQFWNTAPNSEVLEELAFDEINNCLEGPKETNFVCYGTTINDGKTLYIAYSEYLKAWILLYGSHKIALVTSKTQTTIYPNDKPSNSKGFKAAINFWKQTLSRWKMVKVLPIAENELFDYTLMFECAGIRHDPYVFTKEGKDEYTMISIIDNYYKPEERKKFPIISHEEYIRLGSMFGIKRKKWINLCKQMYDIEDLLKILSDFSMAQYENGVTNMLISVENRNEKKVLSFCSIISLHFLLCCGIRDILFENINKSDQKDSKENKIPEIPKITNDQIIFELERKIKNTYNSLQFLMIKDKILKYAEITQKCIDRLQISSFTKGINPKEFPQFLKSTIEIFSTPAHISPKSVEKHKILGEKSVKKGPHLLVFADIGYLKEDLIKEISEKYKLHVFDTIEDMVLNGGIKNSVYYVKNMDKEKLLNYVKNHSCRAILYDFDEKLTCGLVCPGISIVEKNEGNSAEILDLININFKILRAASEMLTEHSPKNPENLHEESKTTSEKNISPEKIIAPLPKPPLQNIVVVSFLGIPGLQINNLAAKIKENLNISEISLDKIKKKRAEEYMIKNPKSTYENAAENTIMSSKLAFNEELKQVLKEAKNTENIQKVIILEKNLAPPTIIPTLQYYYFFIMLK